VYLKGYSRQSRDSPRQRDHDSNITHHNPETLNDSAEDFGDADDPAVVEELVKMIKSNKGRVDGTMYAYRRFEPRGIIDAKKLSFEEEEEMVAQICAETESAPGGVSALSPRPKARPLYSADHRSSFWRCRRNLRSCTTKFRTFRRSPAMLRNSSGQSARAAHTLQAPHPGTRLIVNCLSLSSRYMQADVGESQGKLAQWKRDVWESTHGNPYIKHSQRFVVVFSPSLISCRVTAPPRFCSQNIAAEDARRGVCWADQR
jgi:hypothetical protein